MAQIVTLGFIVFGIVLMWYRHGPGRPIALATAGDELDDDLDYEDDLDYDDLTDTEDAGPGATRTPDRPPA
jgi:hypothetical protein